MPDPADEYEWRWKDGKAHLLKTPLSKLSTKAFLELSNAVQNGSVWAIKRDRDSTNSMMAQFDEIKRDRDSTNAMMAQFDEIKTREKRLRITNACLQKTIQRHKQREEKFRQILAISEQRLKAMLSQLQEAQSSFNSLDPPVFSFE
jgi:DNA-binding NtrC family response regulator